MIEVYHLLDLLSKNIVDCNIFRLSYESSGIILEIGKERIIYRYLLDQNDLNRSVKELYDHIIILHANNVLNYDF